MDITSSRKTKQELQVQQLVLEAFSARLAGEKDYSIEESRDIINKLIKDSN